MWLFSKAGFVSIVAHRDDPTRLLVRGRFPEDIAAIRELLAAAGESVDPFEDPAADYRYRLICTRSAFATVAAELVNTIDYANFKNAVHGNPTRDRAYLRCWSAMNDAQTQA